MPSCAVIKQASEPAAPNGYIGDLPHALPRRIVLEDFDYVEARAHFTVACPHLVIHDSIFNRSDQGDAMVWGPQAEVQGEVLGTISRADRMLDEIWWAKRAALKCAQEKTKGSKEPR